MLERLGRFFCNLTQRLLPDAQVLALLITFLVAAMALFAPQTEPLTSLSPAARLTTLAGLWTKGFANADFLAFALQMCLILLTGYGLAKAPPATRMLDAVAATVRTNQGAVFLVALVSAVGGWINWGFGLIAAGLLAGRVRARFARAGIPCQYPIIVAAAYVTMMTWHGGLSGSAPLKVSHGVPLTRMVDGTPVVQQAAPITIRDTLFSKANLGLSLFLFLGAPLLLRGMVGKEEAVGRQPSAVSPESRVRFTHGLEEPVPPQSAGPPLPGIAPDDSPRLSASGVQPGEGGERGLAAALDHSRWVRTGMVMFTLAALGCQIHLKGWAAVDPTFVILAFLAVGMALHPNVVSYVAAVTEGGRAITGIVLQFPLYGGIEGLLNGSGWAGAISQGFIDAAGWTSDHCGLAPGITFPLATFVSATVVNVFIPSGGGQWMVQGPIMCSAADALGVPLHQTVMAVAYGDELTNMIQPFWAVPLMGLTQVDPRRFMGYCALLMLLAAPAFVVALLCY